MCKQPGLSQHTRAVCFPGPRCSPCCQPTHPSLQQLPSLPCAGDFMPPCCHHSGRNWGGYILLNTLPQALPPHNGVGLSQTPGPITLALGQPALLPSAGCSDAFPSHSSIQQPGPTPSSDSVWLLQSLPSPTTKTICPLPTLGVMAHCSPTLTELRPDPDRGRHRAEPRLSIVSLPPTQIRDPAASRIRSSLGCRQPDWGRKGKREKAAQEEGGLKRKKGRKKKREKDKGKYICLFLKKGKRKKTKDKSKRKRLEAKSTQQLTEGTRSGTGTRTGHQAKGVPPLLKTVYLPNPEMGGGGVGGKSHYLQRLLSPYEALWALHIFNTCTGRQVCLSAQERGKWAGGCLWDFKDLFANREAPGGKQWQHALRQWVMQVNNLLFGKASVFWRPCLTSLLSQLVKTGGWFVATNPSMRFGRCPLLTLWLLSLALRARLVGEKGEFGQHPQQL